jgi:hypothetical protein
MFVTSKKLLKLSQNTKMIYVTVCVFVRHLFSWYPFYFDFHSARIIFDVSFGLLTCILYKKQAHFSQLFCLQVVEVQSVTPRQLHDRKSRCLRGRRPVFVLSILF